MTEPTAAVTWAQASASGPSELHAVGRMNNDRAVGGGDHENRDALAEPQGTAFRVGRHASADSLAAAERQNLGLLGHPHERPSWTFDTDQALGAQLRDRLPHRGPADSVFLDEAQLAGQRVARRQLTRLDLPAQQIGKLAKDSAIGRVIDHVSQLTWP